MLFPTSFISYLLSIALPLYINLSSDFPPVFDQERINSCTANAVTSVVMYNLKHFHHVQEPTMKSRLQVYWFSRLRSLTFLYDSGAHTKDALITLKNIGICDEALNSYSQINVYLPPSFTCIHNAKQTRIDYFKELPLDDITLLKQQLHREFPLVFDLKIYDSIFSSETINTGIMTLPNIDKDTYIGLHSMVIVGYDDLKKMFIVRNSWSDHYGDNGYLYMPYDFLNYQLIKHVYFFY
jgi:hypothetical protein